MISGMSESPGLPSDEVTRARMARQRRRDTVPEVALRRALREEGLGYRVERPLPGMPRRRCDVMFVSARVAVFVDGCFWHRCPVHGTIPARNHGWWEAKLAKNVERDRTTDQHLGDIGWLSIRVWEHADMLHEASAIASEVRKHRGR